MMADKLYFSGMLRHIPLGRLCMVLVALGCMLTLSGNAAAQGLNAAQIFGNAGSGPNERQQEEEPAQPELPALERSMRNVQLYLAKIREINRIIDKQGPLFEIAELLDDTERISTNLKSGALNLEERISLSYNRALMNYITKVDERLEVTGADLHLYSMQLGMARLRLDSITADPMLRSQRAVVDLPEEQLQTILRLRTIAKDADKTLDTRRLEIATYQSIISTYRTELLEYKESLLLQRRDLQRRLLTKESPYPWESSAETDEGPSLAQLALTTININKTILLRYMGHQGLLTFVLLVLVLLLYLWFRWVLHKIKARKEHADVILERAWYLPKHPIKAAFLVVLALAPFVYPSPPTSLMSLLLFVQVAVTGLMLPGRITVHIYVVWLISFLIFALSTLSNLYWQVALQERWFLMALCIAASLLSLYVIKRYKQGFTRLPSYLSTITWVYLGFQLLGLLALATGRFNLGKMLSVSSTMSLHHAISLLVLIIVLKEAVYLQIESSRDKSDELTNYFDFEKLQRKLLQFFFAVSAFIWMYFFLENLSAYDLVMDGISNFMGSPRKVLNANFSYGGILTFFIVLYISYALASNIAFLVSIKDQQFAEEREKRLGSFTLLIKIGIFSIGFVIAVAISGIPLDKLAIVLGALSVGIGFGLQSIVNNLVSGIILAFERPVQPGDRMSVGAIEGVVLSIGVRASKIRNWDGAEVIIPNGDLLSQPLTNWTLSDMRRRVELTIGVAYGSDINKVTTLLRNSLEHKGILEDRRAVFLQQFGDSSLDFRVLFWVRTFDIWLEMRDAVMRSIASAFEENGIEIPFPQRDIHIKQFPAVRHERVRSPSEVTALMEDEQPAAKTSEAQRPPDPGQKAET